MLPDVGPSELLVIAIVALIVVGPKDLPPLLRKLGQFMAKLRGMAADFRASFDEMARQSELDELRKEVEAMRSGQLTATAALEAPLTTVYDGISSGLSDMPSATPYYLGEPAAAETEVVAEAPKPVRKPRVKAAPKADATPAAPRKPRARKAPEAGA